MKLRRQGAYHCEPGEPVTGLQQGPEQTGVGVRDPRDVGDRPYGLGGLRLGECPAEWRHGPAVELSGEDEDEGTALAGIGSRTETACCTAVIEADRRGRRGASGDLPWGLGPGRRRVSAAPPPSSTAGEAEAP